MQVLILDDDEARHEGFKHAYWHLKLRHVYSHPEAVGALEQGPWDVAFLDHDLGLERQGTKDTTGREHTGFDTAKFIVEMPVDKRPKIVVVHSWNPIGALQMYQLLKEAKIEVHRWEFNSTNFPRIHGT